MDIQLSAEFIDSLPKTDVKIIVLYQKHISLQIKTLALTVGFQEARKQINLKYGKFWRERLEHKKDIRCRKVTE